MADVRINRFVQICTLSAFAMACVSPGAFGQNQLSESNQTELRQSNDSVPGECLVLPRHTVNFGNVSHRDIRNWVNVDQWQFTTNTNYLAVGQDDSGEPFLRQKLEPNSKGSVRVLGRGPMTPARTYSLQQSFFLEPGFDWGGRNEGGKLGFGLGGGSTPTGGEQNRDGFSARLMWRGNGDGSARLAVYAYSADRTQNLPYGDDYPVENFQIPIGERFTVTLEVTSNSATGSADGRVRVWVNSELKMQRDNIHWQASGQNPTVDRLLFATFHGGADTSWSPANPVYARFSSVCWQATEYSPVQPEPEQAAALAAEHIPEPNINADIRNRRSLMTQREIMRETKLQYIESQQRQN